jgi:tellurite resistance protein TerC
MFQAFPFHEYWQLYLGFICFLLVIITLDLGLFHKKPHAVSMKEATAWSLIWILLALSFNYWFYEYCLLKFSAHPELISGSGKTPEIFSQQLALEFLTGYLVEKSLAVDNIFVFVVIFNYFAIPSAFQHRILFFGIIGAILFRGLFISLGSILLQYHWVLTVFGVFLIFTGFKLCFAPEKETDLSKNIILRILNKILPISYQTSSFKFFSKKNQTWSATPLFVALLMIEFSDIIFAVDSVPAIFAITKEPFIVFSSNMMALLGLRSLYFLLAGSVDLFYLLKYGLGIVLIFIGLKMVWLNDLFDGHFPIVYSLIFIAGVISGSMLFSVIFPKKRHKKASSKS